MARSILSTAHRALDCGRHREGRERLDLERRGRRHGRRAHREHDVAVVQRPVRRDAAREGVAPRLGQRLELHAVERGVRRHDGDGGVAGQPVGVAEGRAAGGQIAQGVEEAAVRLLEK